MILCLFGLVILWLKISSLDLNFDSKVVVTGDEWGGEVFILGPGAETKKEYERMDGKTKICRKKYSTNEFCGAI